MQYAIIAAGCGERLSQEGISVPKPLVEVGGERLIDRLIRIFMEDGATAVSVVCRSNEKVEKHLRQCQQAGVPLRYIVRNTPSSMHSFFELMPLLDRSQPFVLTTVDTIFREEEFKDYLSTFHHLLQTGVCDGLMGVTDYIDDEKPLYVKTDCDQNIEAFLDERDAAPYVSGGIYGLTPRCLDTLQACVERGNSRMRNYQRALLNDGMRLKAWLFSRIHDIDHAEDVKKATQFLGR